MLTVVVALTFYDFGGFFIWRGVGGTGDELPRDKGEIFKGNLEKTLSNKEENK